MNGVPACMFNTIWLLMISTAMEMRDVKMANIEITYIQFVLIKLLLSPMECMEWLSSRYKLSKACNEILKCLVHVLLV